MTERRSNEPADPRTERKIEKRGGYITPSKPAGVLPVVPSGPAPGAAPSAQSGDKESKK